MPLPEATFDNVSLGPLCTTRTYGNPHARQVNEYPGVNGLEVLNLGSRGGTTEAEGLLYGDTLLDLAAAFGTFIGYVRDGGAYTLEDSFGVSWDSVILVDFRPDGLAKLFTDGGFCRAYKAVFLHII
jgi:hypothetical protein